MKRNFAPVIQGSSQRLLHPSEPMYNPAFGGGKHIKVESCQLAEWDSGLGTSLTSACSYDPTHSYCERTPRTGQFQSQAANSPCHVQHVTGPSTSYLCCSTTSYSSAVTEHTTGRSRACLSLSNNENSTVYRFSGADLSSFSGNCLIQVGSPETDFLSTPKVNKKESKQKQGEDDPALRRLRTGPLQFLPTTPPKSELHRTPSKGLPFSPSNNFGQSDFLGGFTLLATTSTPLREDVYPNDCQSVFAEVKQEPPDESFSVERGGSVACGIVPKTPSPFKKAFAAIEMKRGRLDRSVTLDSTPNQVVRDIQEIMLMDDSSNVRRSSYFDDHGDETMDFSRTPSRCFSDPRNENYTADDRMMLHTSIKPDPDAAPKCSPLKLPRKMPKRLSSKWFEVACGGTPAQRELTAKAKQILGLPP